MLLFFESVVWLVYQIW